MSNAFFAKNDYSEALGEFFSKNNEYIDNFDGILTVIVSNKINENTKENEVFIEKAREILKNMKKEVIFIGKIRENLAFIHFYFSYALDFQAEINKELEKLMSIFLETMKRIPNSNEFEKIDTMRELLFDLILKIMKINEKTLFLFTNTNILKEFLKLFDENKTFSFFSNEITQFSRFFSFFLRTHPIKSEIPDLLASISLLSTLNPSNLVFFFEEQLEKPSFILSLCKNTSNMEEEALSILLLLFNNAFSSRFLKNHQIVIFFSFLVKLLSNYFKNLSKDHQKYPIISSKDPLIDFQSKLFLRILAEIRENNSLKHDIFMQFIENNENETILLPTSELLEMVDVFKHFIDKPGYEAKTPEFLVFILSNLDSFQTKTGVCDIFQTVFKISDSMFKALDNPRFLDRLFSCSLCLEHLDIFMLFLDYFYRNVLLEPELAPFYRNNFMQKLCETLGKMPKDNHYSENFDQKLVVFFLVFIKSVIVQRKPEYHFIEIFQNPDKAFSLETLFSCKVHNCLIYNEFH